MNNENNENNITTPQFGVAYKFKKSNVPFRKKHKLLFPLVFVAFLAGICYMASGLVGSYISVNGNTSGGIKIDKADYYAVCTGSFSSVELASEVAVKVKSLGGAGYVYNNNGEYSVLMYIYAQRNDALSVSTKVSDAGFTTSILTFDCKEQKYDYNLANEDAQSFREILNTFDELYAKLYQISNDFDSKISTISASRLELVQLQKNFERNYSKFISTFSNTKDEKIINLIKQLDIVSSELDLLVDPLMLDSNFASLIKHSCINIIVARKEL